MSLYEWAKQNADRDAWAAAYAEQTALLSAQLQAIDTLKGKKRAAFIDLQYRCRDCGEVVLEVVSTSPYRTLRSRRDTRQRAKDGWTFTPLSDSADPDANRSIVPAVCRCQSRTLNEQMVYRDLASGIMKRTLPVHHDPDYRGQHADD